MFDGYMLDFYDDIEGQHYVRSDFDLLSLLTYVSSLNGFWQIFRGEVIEGIFYPQCLVARSALE